MEDIDKDFREPGAARRYHGGRLELWLRLLPRARTPVPSRPPASRCVIAKSFARIFYRNSINIGLPIMECPEAVDAIEAGDTVQVDFDTGVITDETNGKVFHAEPFPPFIQNIISAGGLMKAIQK